MELGGDRQLVAQVPVLSADPGRVGEHVGTVMVAVDFPPPWERLEGASSYLLTYLGTALLLGVAGSWLLARRIKRQTLGLEPREIAGLAEHREAMLYGIAEGVIALDPDLRVTLVNDVARRLLDLPEHSVGLSLADLRIEGRLREVLSGEAPDDGADETASDSTTHHATDDATSGTGTASARDEVVIRRGRVLVMNRMSVTRDGRHLGTVTTLRDRTELANLERELGSFRSSTELLRAQAHEFANQLHTISGLIQIGDYDEVVRYVDAVSRHRADLDLTVGRRVRDSAVAALLMAKSAYAAERRVALRVTDDTSLERLEPEDAADVATVVGNLVDNAVDAAASSPEPWVEVALRQDATTVEVVVRDSGPGVAPELAQEVFTHGFTTKAARSGERGIGLALTRLVCQRRGGEVSVRNTDEGAMFTAQLTVTAVPEAVR
jgi:sensor histidine kinase regulating citrate/malate metabolism